MSSSKEAHLLRQIDWVREKITKARRIARDGYESSLLRTLEHAVARDHPMLCSHFEKETKKTMHNAEFLEFTEKFTSEMTEILSTKGLDYSDKGDRLVNFKRIAERLNLPVFQVWAIYFLKHVDSVLTFVRDGDVHSEPIRGRFLDIANYALLGAALVEENSLAPVLNPQYTVVRPGPAQSTVVGGKD